jgi:hypothetical protein
MADSTKRYMEQLEKKVMEEQQIDAAQLTNWRRDDLGVADDSFRRHDVEEAPQTRRWRSDDFDVPGDPRRRNADDHRRGRTKNYWNHRDDRRYQPRQDHEQYTYDDHFHATCPQFGRGGAPSGNGTTQKQF